jgi:hypothetical protein
MIAMKSTAKSIKVTLVIDPAPLARVQIPNGTSRVALSVAVAGRNLRADLNAKSARRAIATIAATIAAHGPEAVACILQGRLDGDMVLEAGLAVQPRAVQQTAAPSQEAAAA